MDSHNGEVRSPQNADALFERILELEHDVARKYGHIRKLKTKLRIAKLQIVQLKGGMYLESQSATMAVGEADSKVQAEITTFADESAGWSTTVPTSPDSTFNLANNSDSDLGNFLCRPINVATYQWAVNSPLFEKFNPWSAYLSNTFIRDKIANFELLRMNLHMKVLISGTPFHYGRALVSYNPLSGYDQVTMERGLGASLDADLIGASQKPHIFLNPTLNSGGVMDIPYFYKENYISLTQSGVVENLGEITLRSFGNLRHTDTGNPVTINVYLWATDVTLTMPTSRPLAVLPSQSGVLNSGDEYGQGIISKPASSIAKAAGLLQRVPLIKPYARATEIVANGVGDVARMFGYSRPAVVTDVQLMKPTPTGNLANTDAADAVCKLSLDTKNEVTIDPRVTGLEGKDEMGVLDYVKRESYLASFNWTSDDGPGDMLWNCRVAPDLARLVPYTTPNLAHEFHMTPACHMAQLFKCWQGSIKFRFQVVKSAYHKGRMLVRYDPRSLGSNIDYNTNYSRVIDIADAEDFEIVIGWGQNTPWLDIDPLDTSISSSPTTRLTEALMRTANGVIELNVINELVSPSASSDISVNVFVSMVDDAKFAQPDAEKIQTLSYFREPPLSPSQREPAPLAQSEPALPSQSGMIQGAIDEPLAAKQLDAIASDASPVDQTMNVFFGENVTSIREIIKRYTLMRYFTDVTTGGRRVIIRTLTNKVIPYHRGQDPQGFDEVAGQSHVEVNVSPISYFLPAYAAYRGSMRHKTMFHTDAGSNMPTITRMPFSPDTAGILSIQTLADPPRARAVTHLYDRLSWQGSAATSAAINNTIETEFPFYNKSRFGYARLIRCQDMDCNSVKLTHLSGMDSTANIASSSQNANRFGCQIWTAAGEDFSYYFFTGVPIMYRYENPW